MVSVHFIRHLPPCSSLSGRLYGDGDIPLDETSDEVLLRLNYLAKILPDDAQWSATPVPRTLKTIQHIQQRKNISDDVVIMPAFAEQKFGVIAGRLHKELRHDEEFISYQADPVNYTPRGGECFAHTVARVQEGLQTLTALSGNIVIATHGGILKAILTGVRSITPMDSLNLNISPLSHLHLEFMGNSWREVSLSQGILSAPLTHPALI